MDSAIKRTRRYFEDEFIIGAVEPGQITGTLDMLDFHEMTAAVNIGGPISLLVAFSFEQGLLDALYRHMTADFIVPVDEEAQYREAVAAEIVNIVVGNCTTDLQQQNQGVSMSTPEILDKEKLIQRMKGAVFSCQNLNSEFGRVGINLVGQKEVFDDENHYEKWGTP